MFLQKKRGKGGDGNRNKENIVESVSSSEGKDNGYLSDEEISTQVSKKDLCYEMKTSDIMGR